MALIRRSGVTSPAVTYLGRFPRTRWCDIRSCCLPSHAVLSRS